MKTIFRDEFGRFSTSEKANSYQEIENNKWSELRKVRNKEQEQYDEYEYFIGFDYETPTVASGGKQLTKGQKGIHDFKTEFIIRSPSPLSDSEIKSMILDEYSDYHNVLKNRQAFKNIILQAKRKKNEKVDLEFEPSDLSENIER